MKRDWLIWLVRIEKADTQESDYGICQKSIADFEAVDEKMWK